MSNQLNFDFNSNQIRVINDDPSNLLFVAHDVATALGYTKPRNAIQRFCKGALKQGSVQTKGGPQELTVIAEPDLYRLIFGSKLKSAKAFQDWVFEQVLPSIRKTGKYEKPDPRARFLSEEQCGHIYQTVMSLVGTGNYTYQGLFGMLKKQFQASSYKNILKTDYKAACHYLGVRPLPELQQQADCVKVDNLEHSANWNEIAKHYWGALDHVQMQMDITMQNLNTQFEQIKFLKNRLYDPIHEPRLHQFADKEKVKLHLVKNKQLH